MRRVIGASRAALLGAALSGVASLAVQSAELRVTGAFSQSATVRDNFDDESGSSVATTSTTLGVTFSSQTPTTTWSLSPGATLSGRFGSDVDDPFNVNFRFSGAVQRSGPRLSVFANASVIPQFISEREFDQVLFDGDGDGEPEFDAVRRNVDALEITFSAAAGASYALTPRTRANLGVSGRIREYDEDDDALNPNRSFGVNAGLSQSLSDTRSVSLNASARRFDSDDGDPRDSFTIGLGYNDAFTPRHRVSLSLGASTVDGDNLNFSGGARLSYRASPRTSFNAGVSQRLAQDSDGEVNTVTSAFAGGSHRINSVSSVGVSARLSSDTPILEDGGEGDSDLRFTLSPRYNYSLTERWSMTVGYGLELDEDESDINNRFFISISRSFAEMF